MFALRHTSDGWTTAPRDVQVFTCAAGHEQVLLVEIRCTVDCTEDMAVIAAIPSAGLHVTGSDEPCNAIEQLCHAFPSTEPLSEAVRMPAPAGHAAASTSGGSGSTTTGPVAGTSPGSTSAHAGNKRARAHSTDTTTDTIWQAMGHAEIEEQLGLPGNRLEQLYPAHSFTLLVARLNGLHTAHPDGEHAAQEASDDAAADGQTHSALASRLLQARAGGAAAHSRGRTVWLLAKFGSPVAGYLYVPSRPVVSGAPMAVLGVGDAHTAARSDPATDSNSPEYEEPVPWNCTMWSAGTVARDDAHTGGKTPEEMTTNMQRRFASGSKRTLVPPHISSSVALASVMQLLAGWDRAVADATREADLPSQTLRMRKVLLAEPADTLIALRMYPAEPAGADE